MNTAEKIKFPRMEISRIVECRNRVVGFSYLFTEIIFLDDWIIKNKMVF
jgi:hypothetical protein